MFFFLILKILNIKNIIFYFFLNMCDVEILANFAPKIAKLVEITLAKKHLKFFSKISQIVFVGSRVQIQTHLNTKILYVPEGSGQVGGF